MFQGALGVVDESADVGIAALRGCVDPVVPGRDSHRDTAAVAEKRESRRRAGGPDADAAAGRCGSEHQPAIALDGDRARVGRDICRALIALQTDSAVLGVHVDRDVIGHLDQVVRNARAEDERRTARDEMQNPKPDEALLTRAVPKDRVVGTANRNTRPAAANDRDIAGLHAQLDPKQRSRHCVGDSRGAGAGEPQSGEHRRPGDHRHQRTNDEERPRRKAPQPAARGTRLRRSGKRAQRSSALQLTTARQHSYNRSYRSPRRSPTAQARQRPRRTLVSGAPWGQAYPRTLGCTMQRQALAAKLADHLDQRNERHDRRRRLIALPARLPPRSQDATPGAAIEPFVQLADAAGIAGLIAGLAAVGPSTDAVGAVALVLGLVGGKRAADRVATRAWDARLKLDSLRGLASDRLGGAICASVKQGW